MSVPILKTIPYTHPYDESQEPLGTVDTGPPKAWKHYYNFPVQPSGTPVTALCGQPYLSSGGVGPLGPDGCPDCIRTWKTGR